MAMTVRDHIDRNAINVDSDVGAVVGIKAAQEDLLGFAAASVLGNDQSRRHLQHLVGGATRPDLQVERAHRARGSRRIGPFGLHQHFAEMDGTRMQMQVESGLAFGPYLHLALVGFVSNDARAHNIRTRDDALQGKTAL